MSLIASDLNWAALGRQLRESADDAHEGNTPPVALAYAFLLENPGCFVFEGDEWPDFMPVEPPGKLVEGYYGKGYDSDYQSIDRPARFAAAAARPVVETLGAVEPKTKRGN